MDNLIYCLNDISRLNVIYTVLLLATANSLKFQNPGEILLNIIMNYNTSFLMATETGLVNYGSVVIVKNNNLKPSLLMRMAQKLAFITNNLLSYVQNQFDEHTATSIASFSVLIIVISIICCFIISLMREEERKIKDQYKKLNTGSSQSFIAISNHNTSYQGCNGYQKIGNQQLGNTAIDSASFFPSSSGSAPISSNRNDFQKVHLIELRRETYFGLVRLLKPGCRTIVLLCDTQSRIKLLTKFYQCIYPYRKNKTLQFAFLLIEKNIGWYRDLLKLALNEKRDLQINPINCIGTVLVINGFKKYFSVYHASDSRQDPDEPLILLEESLLDNFSEWLERLFAGKANRYYVKYWPDQMR